MVSSVSLWNLFVTFPASYTAFIDWVCSRIKIMGRGNIKYQGKIDSSNIKAKKSFYMKTFPIFVVCF